MRIEWHPEASAEFAVGLDWYDRRAVSAGDRFEADVLAAVRAVSDMPAAWPEWPGSDRGPIVRSKGVTDFPYRVVYVAGDDVLMILAVAHTKRIPGYWRHRVEE